MILLFANFTKYDAGIVDEAHKVGVMDDGGIVYHVAF